MLRLMLRSLLNLMLREERFWTEALARGRSRPRRSMTLTKTWTTKRKKMSLSMMMEVIQIATVKKEKKTRKVSMKKCKWKLTSKNLRQSSKMLI